MVVTDYKPLVGIFTSSLDKLQNLRLLRIREKLTDCVFSITWVAGKIHEITDALSQYPAFSGEELGDLLMDRSSLPSPPPITSLILSAS